MPAPAEASALCTSNVYSRRRRKAQQLQQEAWQQYEPKLHPRVTATDRVLQQAKLQRQAAAEGSRSAASEALHREYQELREEAAMEDARVLLRDRLELRTGQRPMLL